MRILFALTSALGAFLLFWVQPLMGKMLLPFFGGAPTVWIVALFFFQALLLSSYGFVHVVDRFVLGRGRVLAAVILSAVFFLPLLLTTGRSSGDWPVLRVLGLLFLSVGLPVFALGFTSPFLQRLFSSSARTRHLDPYPLYAAGNAGSLAALAFFPTVLERVWAVPLQQIIWSAGWILWAGLMGVCAWLAGPGGAAQPVLPEVSPARADKFRWVLWAAIPSALSLSMTAHLSMDIAPTPLLWVFPLGLYLLTYMLAFARPGWGRGPAWLMPLLILAAVAVKAQPGRFPSWISVPVPLALLFVVSWRYHGALSRGRPGPAHLTSFYLWLSVGGLLGGAFTGLVAPVLFKGLWEYPLALLAAAWFWPEKAGVPRGLGGRSVAAISALLLTAVAFMPSPGGRVLWRDRSFYGMFSVDQDHGNQVRSLSHGVTVHGAQRLTPGAEREPIAYYSPVGPVGDVFHYFLQGPPPRFVGVIGLGVGALVSYGQPRQPWTFYELDPHVARLAEDPLWFGLLSSARAPYRILMGDGRLRLAEAPEGHYDLLILDAFGSDAVPIHLLTREALSLYGRKLSARGTLVLHISNRFLDLERVLADTGASLGWRGLSRNQTSLPLGDLKVGRLPSHWVVFTRDSALRENLLQKRGWRWMVPAKKGRVWTDDQSDILGVFRWGGA